MIVGSRLFFVDGLVHERCENFLLLFRIPNMAQDPKIAQARRVSTA